MTRSTPLQRKLVSAALAAASLAALASCATEPGAPAPTGTATPAPRLAAADVVPDRYLVQLRPETPGNQVKGIAERLVAEHGGKLGWVYEHASRGFAVGDLPEAAMRKLADEPEVVHVEPDVYGGVDTTQTGAPAHLDRVDQRTRELDGKFSDDGSTAVPTIYVLDSGLNTRHAEFGGRASVAHIFAPPDPDEPAGDAPFGADCNGHGTHVAGIAAGATRGVAKTAKIVAIKVTTGCAVPRVRAGDLSEAIDFIVGSPAPRSVVSISIGLSPGVQDGETVRTSVENATKAGIPIVVSAGNDSGDACQQTPALVPQAITVAATRASSDARLPASNFGDCVDIFAPGENIESASHLSNSAFVRKTGTSMATPMVAGAVALLRARPISTIAPIDIYRELRNQATYGVVADSRTRGDRSGLLHVGGFYQGGRMPIPDTGVAAVSRISITNQADELLPRSIEVFVRATHLARGQLQFALFTPQGRRIPLQHPTTGSGNVIDFRTRVTTEGLPSNGTWTLTVTDTVRGTTGAFNGWTIQV